MHDLLQTLNSIPLTPGEEPPVCCRMWWTFNIFYLIVQILLKQKREILLLSHYVFYFLKNSVEKIFNYLKAIRILEEFQFSDVFVLVFGYICVLTTF